MLLAPLFMIFCCYVVRPGSSWRPARLSGRQNCSSSDGAPRGGRKDWDSNNRRRIFVSFGGVTRRKGHAAFTYLLPPAAACPRSHHNSVGSSSFALLAAAAGAPVLLAEVFIVQHHLLPVVCPSEQPDPPLEELGLERCRQHGRQRGEGRFHRRHVRECGRARASWSGMKRP